jgi:hypothetical protein
MCKHLTHKGFRQFVAGADSNCPLLSPTMVPSVFTHLTGESVNVSIL